jgi:transposase-like protein
MARSLRVEQQLTVDELAARLSLPRSTIYYWVRDLPLRDGVPGGTHGEVPGERAAGAEASARGLAERADGQPRRSGAVPQRAGGRTARKVSRARSDAAYEEGLATFEELAAQPTFRDFVCVYLVQGEQRDRTRVALTNSDPAVMRLVSRWIRRLTDRALLLSLQYGPDQSLKDLRLFWGETTGAEPRTIRVRGPAEESDGQPAPGWPHGVLTVTVDDTLLRARLQGWIQRTRETWL